MRMHCKRIILIEGTVKMNRIIVFGASKNDKRMHDIIQEDYEIVAFTDNDETKWGKEINKIKIIPPSEILSLKWDEIVVLSITGMYVIRDQLISYGIQKNVINLSYMELQIKAREQFLSDFASIVYKRNMRGEVAEAGVFQGEFAKVINKNFPDKKLYLFDTFEGFDDRDIVYEEKNNFSSEQKGHLNMTSEDLVMQKMTYPLNCIIRKGYFPETAEGIDDTFCFVNLDMDLYKPTLEGLRFFWNRMEQGGVVLVHDYFSEAYKGVENAVEEFVEKEKDAHLFPIGDSISIGMLKV